MNESESWESAIAQSKGKSSQTRRSLFSRRSNIPKQDALALSELRILRFQIIDLQKTKRSGRKERNGLSELTNINNDWRCDKRK
jgi:hypothetical protein